MQNYKIFINNSLIFFGRKQGTPPNNLTWSDFQYIKNNQIKELVDKIESLQELDHFFIDEEDIENAFHEFASHFKVLQAAGGLVINNLDQILMIHRFGYWDFPKGKVEKGETIGIAAIREVEEETGAQDLSISKQLPTVYHIYNYSDQWILKETFWYLMNTDYQGALIPQLEEDIIAAKWIPIDFLSEYINQSYLALQELVKDIGLLR